MVLGDPASPIRSGRGRSYCRGRFATSLAAAVEMTINPNEDATCLVCSEDRTIALSLREAIKESREWLETHPHVAGDFPNINGLKLMLSEACDFAATMLDCITIGRTAPAYANFRCMLERAHLAMHFASRDNVGWEYQSMARRQESLSRLITHTPLNEREWPKEYLDAIRRWNCQPDDGKPTSMQRHTKYDPNIEKMPPPMHEWYEVCSMYVHPTFMGEQNIGRGLRQSEIDALTFTGHGYFCIISYTTRWIDHIIDEALCNSADPPSEDADFLGLWEKLLEIRRGRQLG